MKRLVVMLGVTCCTVLGLMAQGQGASPLDDATRGKAEESIGRGVAFLLRKQGEDGSWLQHPAMTSLVCTGLVKSPTGSTPAIDAAVNRGLDFVVKHAQSDGSIWNKQTEEYPNYSTAISVIALITKNRPQDLEIIKRARAFLLDSQFADAAKDGASLGGIGYGKKLRPDLSNTQWALEALYLTDHLDREPFSSDPVKAKKADLAWGRAIEFLSACQNLKETNKATWVVSDPDNKGGFVYLPGESKAGEVKKEDDDGAGLRSYGSMTYAGLKSMVYAKVNRDDPRVKGALEWIQRHFTFAENPGMGSAGHYYYLHTCAKALAAYGDETLTDAAGKPHAWRTEFITQVLGMQKSDGSWANENGRWMESVPELSTAYTVLSLEAVVNSAPAAAAK